jgi:hypothetical protein
MTEKKSLNSPQQIPFLSARAFFRKERAGLRGGRGWRSAFILGEETCTKEK